MLVHDEPHEGPIRTPRQLVIAVIFAFIVPVAVIVLLAEFVTSGQRPAAGTEALQTRAVAERIQPVGSVVVRDPSDAASVRTGEQVFQAQCTTCHTPGLVGAPKFGDAAAWAPRIRTGFEALLNSALHGKGSMGPQGGGDFSDLEVARAVVYMANKGGASFPEPKLPASAASGAGGDAAAAAAASGAAAASAVTASASGSGSGSASAAPSAAMATAAVAAATGAATASSPSASPAASAAANSTTTAAAPAKTGSADTPPALYTQLCQTCHATGIAGAPKLGDKAAWSARLAEAKDVDGLTAVAIKGKGAMPPKGGSTASDAEIREVVAFMVAHSK